MGGDESKPEINLDDAYSVTTPGENKVLYAQWATTYEEAFVDAKKYRYPRAIAELFDEIMPTEMGNLIADVGCGTGLVGLYLTSVRDQVEIDGFDISPEMLNEARAKKRNTGASVYRYFIEADLTQKISNAYGPYDGIISSGTFTHGHLGPEAISNLLPLAREGGWFLIGVNAEHFAAKAFESELQSLEREGEISKPIFQKIHVYETGSPHYGDQSVTVRFMRL